MLARMGQPADRAAVRFAAAVAGEPRCWAEALFKLGQMADALTEQMDREADPG